MNVLGFDTATAASAACVLRSDGETFEVVPAVERLGRPPAHASELMPAVAEVMERAAVDWDDLDAVAVGVGPGMFTGLRIGIATARALATAADVPLRRVSSLAALAAGIDGGQRLPLIDARRGEVFAALFDGDRELWPRFASAPEGLLARLREDGFAPLAAGDGSLRFRGMLQEAGIQVAPEDSTDHVVRAFHICNLGKGARDESPEAVLPDYLREPDARPHA